MLQEEDAPCETMLNVVESTPMLSSLREAIKDLPRIRDALNNETATDTFFAPSNEAIQSFTAWGGYADFKEGLSKMFSNDEIKALVVAYHSLVTRLIALHLVAEGAPRRGKEGGA